MRTIRISNEVWDAIAEKGMFGETPDDVLLRVFNIAKNPVIKRGGRIATRRMRAIVQDNRLFVSFVDGPSDEWDLTDADDKNTIRMIRDEAVKFAHINYATRGQIHAVKKALTEEGYFVR